MLNLSARNTKNGFVKRAIETLRPFKATTQANVKSYGSSEHVRYVHKETKGWKTLLTLLFVASYIDMYVEC